MSNKHNMREESGMSLCITGKDFTVHKNPDCIYVTNPEIIRFLIAANFKSGKEAFVKFIWRSGTLDDGGQPEEARMADEQQVEHSAEDLERARKIVVTMLKRRKETLDNPEYGGTEIDYWADEIQAQFATIRAEERQKAEKLLAEAEKCDLVQRLRMFAENSENADWSDGINRAADELAEWLAARGRPE